MLAGGCSMTKAEYPETKWWIKWSLEAQIWKGHSAPFYCLLLPGIPQANPAPRGWEVDSTSCWKAFKVSLPKEWALERKPLLSHGLELYGKDPELGEMYVFKNFLIVFQKVLTLFWEYVILIPYLLFVFISFYHNNKSCNLLRAPNVRDTVQLMRCLYTFISQVYHYSVRYHSHFSDQ